MAGMLVPDELWNEIAALFPKHVQSPEGGRHPKDQRQILTAIVFVLKTGIGWKDLPQDAFGCSYRTCQRRLKEWTETGLWQRIHEHLLAKLRAADQLDFSRVLIDCSLVKAPLGGQKPGRIQRIEVDREVSIAC